MTDKEMVERHIKAINKRERNKVIMPLVTIGVIVLCIGGCFAMYAIKGSRSSTTKKEHSEVVYNSSFDGSVAQVEKYLEKNLKDPDSYEAIEWSDVKKVEGQSHRFVVRHKYRAKNGFGGMKIENKLFYLDGSGNVIDYKDYRK